MITCVVCLSPEGLPVKKAANGRPKGVVLCAECLKAIELRQVGIGTNPDGSLHITDGRA